jgi:outer membrane murein-binding lipoprotein Lpp
VSAITRSSRAAVDIEEIESTKSEKLLAVVLAVFLLIGGIWTYQKIDDVVRDTTRVTLSPAEQGAQQGFSDAQTRVYLAQEEEGAARSNLELSREAYRTALDAGQPAGDLEAAYHEAEDRFAAAQVVRRDAERAVEAARPAAAAASEHQARGFRHTELIAFLVRLAFVLATLGGAYLVLGALRKRQSRYFALGLAAVGFAAILALFMAGDYVTDYFDPLELGPLVLALVGIALTLAAFAALQRHLARRVPIRRVRKRECPFCGFPVGTNDHCEGCGREVIAECATCVEPRRVGTLHCGACGHA